MSSGMYPVDASLTSSTQPPFFSAGVWDHIMCLILQYYYKAVRVGVDRPRLVVSHSTCPPLSPSFFQQRGNDSSSDSCDVGTPTIATAAVAIVRFVPEAPPQPASPDTGVADIVSTVFSRSCGGPCMGAQAEATVSSSFAASPVVCTVCVCVFIIAVPIIKLFAWGEEDSGGHVP